MKILILINILLCIGTLSAHTETGKASFYSTECNGGNRTASGERLINSAMTAAHKTLPFGTLLRVTNLKNNKSEIVRITDRGPHIKGRIIDVTTLVAEKLGFKKDGIVNVKIEVVGKVKIK
jgi:rare lipoprotein A